MKPWIWQALLAVLWIAMNTALLLNELIANGWTRQAVIRAVVTALGLIYCYIAYTTRKKSQSDAE
ncbi:hypothetical protein [Kineosporia sp. NBRC 101731]|uniref:hypothetical protein n=1 Tax=Kineosporia sp. NBRC 101731 TaxID=3032199 RepID=UPI0024A20290|nr:hypothetical protein [Kineosporia sp. NBRC 101731]GLY33553.1 hypothetical protein Kisp02_69180 [Kineosporia sp. NBRC 101731]